MWMRTLFAASLLAVVSAPAFAFHCSADIKAIDAGFGKLSLSASDKAQVMSLRNSGAAHHQAGRHKEAVDDLAKGMRLMLNSGS